MVPIGTISWGSVVPSGTRCQERSEMSTASRPKESEERGDESSVRARILDAAFAAFTSSGYAAASTLKIATRARVSKRELYALVGNKQEMLIACIGARARRLQVPADFPVPHDRENLP